MTRSTGPIRRTKRLEELLSKVHINWSDDLMCANVQGVRWEILHVTFGRTNSLILNMRENGYQIYVIDSQPVAGESVDEEFLRLNKPVSRVPIPSEVSAGVDRGPQPCVGNSQPAASRPKVPVSRRRKRNSTTPTPPPG